MTPYDPVVSIFRLFLDSLPDFLDCFYHVAFFELGEGPMHVGVVTVSIEFLGLAADIERLFVDHMHIEEEGQIVVGERVGVVDQNAPFKVFHCLRVVSNLEVRETQVVMQLGIV